MLRIFKKNKTSQLKQDIRKHTTTAIAAAFALTIALTWNSTIRAIVDAFVTKLGMPETVYLHEIIIAAIITVICVIGIIISSKYSIKKE